MRRTVFLALFAALALVVVPTTAHAQSNEDILRDCADDGILQGDYSASAMRKARNDIPAELDEYSDCRDVLSREISAKTANSSNGGGDSAGGGGGGGSSTGGGGGGGTSDPAPNPTTAPQPTATPSNRDPGIVMGPSTPDDFKAIDGAARHGADAIKVSGREISPSANVGRNGLPGTVIAVLALLAAAALAATVPFVRRRVFTHSSPV